MKSLLVSLLFLFTVNVAIAQSGFSVEVSLKDGSAVKGTVVEYKKDDYIILEIGAGRNLKFTASEISSINRASNLPAGNEISESGQNTGQGVENTTGKWSFSINQLTGIGIGGGNSTLLNISPTLRTYFSVSPFLQIGLGIGYSNIQSNEKAIILRSGVYYAYPNGTYATSQGSVSPYILKAVSIPKSTAYELINSQINFRINYSAQNKPVQFFSELGLGFGYALEKDLNIDMESEILKRYAWSVDPITTMNIYKEYSYKNYANFKSRYSNAMLIELGTGVKFKTINKQHLELKVSYQNTRGNINYTYTQPYAKPTEGTFPPDISNISTKVVESKAKDFLNLSFIAFSVGYSF
jgi:hypothetical protein